MSENWHEGAMQILRDVFWMHPRSYATYDFGRKKDQDCVSVITTPFWAKNKLPLVRRMVSSGLIAFMGTQHKYWDKTLNYEDAEVVIGVGQDQFDIIRLARTFPANYNLSTEDVVRKLMQYDENFGIDITHAETDTVEFRLLKIPSDFNRFIIDLGSFCPDIVTQEFGSITALREYVKAKKHVYLWWD